MAKKLLAYTLIFLILSLGGLGLLATLDLLGSDIPSRMMRRVVHQLPAQQPNSFFVPTPLPLDESTTTNLSSTFLDSVPSSLAVLVVTATPTVTPIPSASEAFSNGEEGVSADGITDSAISNEPAANLGSQAQAHTPTVQEQVDQHLASTPESSQPLPANSTGKSPQLQLLPTSSRAGVTPVPLANSIALTGFNHEWQTWNNCGPATLAMNLSYFGSPLDQAEIGAMLRQHQDDKNVTPEEMVLFAQSQGYSAQVRVNGSSTLLKKLLSNQIPVLIETWMEPDPNDGMGHYRLLTGYDDYAEHWIAFDSYVSHDFVRDGENYEGIIVPYEDADAMWRVFNRTYLLIYDESQRDLIRAIIGDALDPHMMWQQSLLNAQEELTFEPENPFVWFNLGSTFTALGNYSEAAAAFDQARQLGLPWRMLWYQFGPFEAYYKTGRYDEVMALAYATIATSDSIEEVYYWKGKGLAATGNPQSAERAWRVALTLNPSYQMALDALGAVE